MAKILFVNPNKWGRGITHIWIASHSGILKRNNHTVELFDATFYSDWSLNEVKFQTKNKMYKQTNYDDYLKFNSNNVLDDLQKKIFEFSPDFIFWSAISSHIHGEGEYVNIQNGYDLLKDLDYYDEKLKISSDYDFIIRLFKKNNIKIYFLNKFTVKMRSGGISNKNIKNILIKMSEDFRIMKKFKLNAIKTIMMKNLSKIIQFF